MTFTLGVDVLRRQFQGRGVALPRVMELLDSSARRMGDLLGDLDDYVTVHFAGGLTVHPQRINLRAVCEEVVDEARLAHPDHEIELLRGENLLATVDPRRMRQLLRNLVENAVDHGASDRPVRVSVRHGTGACEITVTNEGTPLPEDVLSTLFEPFRRGPGSGSASQRGHMGLGLFIVKQIADAHGASIAVESTLEGTRFTMRLPTQPFILGTIDGAPAQ